MTHTHAIYQFNKVVYFHNQYFTFLFYSSNIFMSFISFVILGSLILVFGRTEHLYISNYIFTYILTNTFKKEFDTIEAAEAVLAFSP